jgi:hypothetical protein
MKNQTLTSTSKYSFINIGCKGKLQSCWFDQCVFSKACQYAMTTMLLILFFYYDLKPTPLCKIVVTFDLHTSCNFFKHGAHVQNIYIALIIGVLSHILSFRLIPLQQWNLNAMKFVLEIEKFQIRAERFFDGLFRVLLTPNSILYKNIDSQFETSICE